MQNPYLRSKFLTRKQMNKVQQNKYGNVSRESGALEISGLDYPLRQRPIPDKRNLQNNRSNSNTLNA